MKYYVSGELEIELFDEYAVERCKKCPYCYHNNDGSHSCITSNEGWVIEEEFTYDDGSLECWLP